MKVQDIYDYLNILAPVDTQMDFDNAGFLIGDPDREVHRVLLSLDVTDSVIHEAQERGAELIISHHPVILRPLKNLKSGPETDKLLLLIRNEISVLSFHTNLDIAEGGVNDVLLELLEAERSDMLDRDGCGRVGEYAEARDFYDYLNFCKEKLGAPGLRYTYAGKPVKRLAVMGGAGASAIRDAWEKGCDTYLTSDLKYHDFLLGSELGLNLIDAGHFHTENPVMDVLRRKLAEAFPEVEFIPGNNSYYKIFFLT